MPDESPIVDQPSFNLVGEKVALGPLRRELVPLYLRWINDFEVTRTLGQRLRPLTMEDEQAWYDRAARSEQEFYFTIYERDTRRPIGTTALRNVDFLHRTADFGIVIGEKACWGKGYGTEVTRLMLDYGFNSLDLHNIQLSVLKDNERGLRAYLRAGFTEIGCRRAARRRNGKAYDLIYMDCLATEFQSPVLRQFLEGPGQADTVD